MSGIRVSILIFFFMSLCQGENVPLVRSHVESESPFVGNDLLVELRGVSGRPESGYQASVTSSGGFEFRDVKGGAYTMRLNTMRGETICEQLVDLLPYSGELSIRMPKALGARPGSGVISVHQLQHPIQPKAFRAFADAQRASEAGHGDEAMRKLEQALRIDPDYEAARC